MITPVIPRTSEMIYRESPGAQLAVVPLEGGAPTQPSPDGRTLAIVRGQLARDAFRLTHFR